MQRPIQMPEGLVGLLLLAPSEKSNRAYADGGHRSRLGYWVGRVLDASAPGSRIEGVDIEQLINRRVVTIAVALSKASGDSHGSIGIGVGSRPITHIAIRS